MPGNFSVEDIEIEKKIYTNCEKKERKNKKNWNQNISNNFKTVEDKKREKERKRPIERQAVQLNIDIWSIAFLLIKG